MNKYVQIAKRERNNKRGFLIVNRYLGKHVPQEPQKILNLFDKQQLDFQTGLESKAYPSNRFCRNSRLL